MLYPAIWSCRRYITA